MYRFCLFLTLCTLGCTDNMWSLDEDFDAVPGPLSSDGGVLDTPQDAANSLDASSDTTDAAPPPRPAWADCSCETNIDGCAIEPGWKSMIASNGRNDTGEACFPWPSCNPETGDLQFVECCHCGCPDTLPVCGIANEPYDGVFVCLAQGWSTRLGEVADCIPATQLPEEGCSEVPKPAALDMCHSSCITELRCHSSSESWGRICLSCMSCNPVSLPGRSGYFSQCNDYRGEHGAIRNCATAVESCTPLKDLQDQHGPNDIIAYDNETELCRTHVASQREVAPEEYCFLRLAGIAGTSAPDQITDWCECSPDDPVN